MTTRDKFLPIHRHIPKNSERKSKGRGLSSMADTRREFAKGLTMSRQPEAAMKKYGRARTTG